MKTTKREFERPIVYNLDSLEKLKASELRSTLIKLDEFCEEILTRNQDLKGMNNAHENLIVNLRKKYKHIIVVNKQLNKSIRAEMLNEISSNIIRDSLIKIFADNEQQVKDISSYLKREAETQEKMLMNGNSKTKEISKEGQMESELAKISEEKKEEKVPENIVQSTDEDLVNLEKTPNDDILENGNSNEISSEESNSEQPTKDLNGKIEEKSEIPETKFNITDSFKTLVASLDKLYLGTRSVCSLNSYYGVYQITNYKRFVK